jgi:hypothetical protein
MGSGLRASAKIPRKMRSPWCAARVIRDGGGGEELHDPGEEGVGRARAGCAGACTTVNPRMNAPANGSVHEYRAARQKARTSARARLTAACAVATARRHECASSAASGSWWLSSKCVA